MTASSAGPPQEVLEAFRLGGAVVSVERWGAGHIHASYRSEVETSGGSIRFLHQRINREVFTAPEAVMANIERITGHIRDKLVASGRNPGRRVLQWVPTLEGASFWRGVDGECWRTFRFVDGATAFETAQTCDRARAVAAAFARYQRMLDDLPDPPLHETIPRFGDPLGRFEDFQSAVLADSRGRAGQAAAEIEFARRRHTLVREAADEVRSGVVPRRVVHFDTKINNVLIDDDTGEGLCVIDLDTTMPGTLLYDFGDLVRSAAARADEDERDPARVGLDTDLFDAIAAGYLEAARGFITPAEVDRLARWARVVTFTIGLRFLTDFLQGDVYFRTTRAGQNLDRCRTQLAMVRDMESQAELLQAIVARHAG